LDKIPADSLSDFLAVCLCSGGGGSSACMRGACGCASLRQMSFLPHQIKQKMENRDPQSRGWCLGAMRSGRIIPYQYRKEVYVMFPLRKSLVRPGLRCWLVTGLQALYCSGKQASKQTEMSVENKTRGQEGRSGQGRGRGREGGKKGTWN